MSGSRAEFRDARATLVALALLALTATSATAQPTARVTVGSKAFTESVILGEVAALLAKDAGLQVVHQRQLGGTQILWKALISGEIDVYPEYTGTIDQELFPDQPLTSAQAIRAALAGVGIRMTEPLGFNNTYAIGMQRKEATRLGIRSISDLRRLPDLRFGFANEFMDRADGWPSLQARYQLPQRDVRGLSHSLCYRALAAGDIHAMDVYSTDAEIKLYDLQLLNDDLAHFPRYDAVLLYRSQLEQTAPDWLERLQGLAGKIDETTMIEMNAAVQVGRDSEQQAAADYLSSQFNMQVTVEHRGWLSRLAEHTQDHLLLVVVSLSMAIVVAVPLGVVAAKQPKWGQLILSAAEIVQTIPGLALLVLLMPLVAGVGFRAVGPAPAIVALFMYSLLPIVRNTYTGIRDIPDDLRQSAEALGLSPRARLWQVELPLASGMILAGIKTTAAINVGYATLGGLIGAGGYGEPIMTGLRLYDERLMLEGAIPAALLALAVKGVFELAEGRLVPRGLRL